MEIGGRLAALSSIVVEFVERRHKKDIAELRTNTLGYKTFFENVEIQTLNSKTLYCRTRTQTLALVPSACEPAGVASSSSSHGVLKATPLTIVALFC